MKKITLIFSLLVVTIVSAFAQTEYTLDVANCQLTDIDPDGSRGRCLIFQTVEDPQLEFKLTMDEYLMSAFPKIVTNTANVAKNITMTAPEDYNIIGCSLSFISSANKKIATVNFGNDIKSNSSSSTTETVIGDNSANPSNSISFTVESNTAYQGITIKELKVSVKSNKTEGEVEGGDNNQGGEGEGEVEGGDNNQGGEGEGEVEGGDNNQGGEGEGEVEGGDNNEGNEGEVEGGDNNQGGEVEGGETSINEVKVENTQVIYDLTGRRVNEITKAGIYIINGKKVIK